MNRHFSVSLRWCLQVIVHLTLIRTNELQSNLETNKRKMLNEALIIIKTSDQLCDCFAEFMS